MTILPLVAFFAVIGSGATFFWWLNPPFLGELKRIPIEKNGPLDGDPKGEPYKKRPLRAR